MPSRNAGTRRKPKRITSGGPGPGSRSRTRIGIARTVTRRPAGRSRRVR